jgi:L-ectoine synthase
VPDTIYALDKNDRHQFEAVEDTILLSIFNPPVKGSEVHKKDGSYEV